MRDEKKIVQDFYDGYGWEKNEDGDFNDTSDFVDIRPVMEDYSAKFAQRLENLILPQGSIFMDAGCGPQVYDA